MKPILFVGNQNYSSWSLRPYLVLRWAKIDFDLRVIPLGGEGYSERRMPAVLAVSPAGTVPVLHWGEEIIGDSLAIAEWAAEQHPALWPRDPVARAHARAATCEMHAGFSEIRSNLTCNIRRRAEPRALSAGTQREIDRMGAIWTSLRARFGQSGPYLFGKDPTIPDAFFTPMATRFRTYAVALPAAAQSYATALLENPDFKVWEQQGAAESWRMERFDNA